MSDAEPMEPRSPFQFNLSALLLLMLAACVLTWIFFVLPGEVFVIVLALTMPLAPSIVLAGAIYFRGYWQAFFIGCGPPSAMALISLGGFPFMRWRMFGGMGPGDDWELKVVLLGGLVVCGLCGAASVGIRYLSLRPPGKPRLKPVSRFPGLPSESGPHDGGPVGTTVPSKSESPH